MLSRASLIDDFARLLTHFDLEQLKDVVIPKLEPLSWDDIKENIVKEKLQLTAKSVRLILIDALKKFSKDDLTRNLYDIMLEDVAHHSKRKFWVACEMQGNPQGRLVFKSIERNLTQACRRNNLECTVRVLLHDDLVWMMAIERKLTRNRGVIMQKPLFCAYYWEERYLFFSPYPKPDMVKAMAQTFHYESGSILKLRGHFIESLFRILMNKISQASSLATFLGTPFTPDPPTVTSFGIDYTGLPARLQYTKDFFGDDPPVISEFTVKDQDAVWQGTTHIPHMKEKGIASNVVFKSNNVLLMLQEMIEIGAISLPLPTFIEKFTAKAQTVTTTR